MSVIVAWFKSKNISAHTLAALAIVAAGIVTTDPQVRDFITQLFQAHPVIAVDIIALAGIVAKYSHSSSPAGTLARARGIVGVTSAQVDAADTATK